jgi:CDGSH-type Zn-finger protein
MEGRTAGLIRISPDGPLDFRGQIEIDAEDGQAIFSDTRASICRCGASQNKPLCDGGHAKISFSDAGLAAPAADGDAGASGSGNGDAMKISPRLNGPLHVQGNLQIENARGEVIFRGDDAWLCRCGGSKNKPFCDGTHKAIGFRSGEREGFPPSRAKA